MDPAQAQTFFYQTSMGFRNISPCSEIRLLQLKSPTEVTHWWYDINAAAGSIFVHLNELDTSSIDFPKYQPLAQITSRCSPLILSPWKFLWHQQSFTNILLFWMDLMDLLYLFTLWNDDQYCAMAQAWILAKYWLFCHSLVLCSTSQN